MSELIKGGAPEEQAGSSAGTVKISANLPASTFEQLRWLASQSGTTMTEVLRRAVNNEAYFRGVSEQGGKVLTEDSKGVVRQIIVR